MSTQLIVIAAIDMKINIFHIFIFLVKYDRCRLFVCMVWWESSCCVFRTKFWMKVVGRRMNDCRDRLQTCSRQGLRVMVQMMMMMRNLCCLPSHRGSRLWSTNLQISDCYRCLQSLIFLKTVDAVIIISKHFLYMYCVDQLNDVHVYWCNVLILWRKKTFSFS